jgi:hypothetical protein
MWHDEFELPKTGRDLFGFGLNTRFAIGPLTAGLIGAGVGGGLSSVFGKKKKPKLLMLPEQRQAYRTLLPSATAKGMQFMQIGSEPYSGDLVAPMSEFEQLGVGTLGDYLSSPLPTEGNLYGLSAGELEKTLEGKEYDPATGPFYEAYRTNVMRDLQRLTDAIRQRAAGAGGRSVFAGGPVQEERELMLGGQANLAEILGRLYEGERARRLGAVPLALQTMGWAEQVPQARVAASQEYGALPRLIEQAEYVARYQDFIRQLQNMGMSLQAATSLATSKPEYWMPTPTDTTGMGQGLGALAMLAMLGGKPSTDTTGLTSVGAGGNVSGSQGSTGGPNIGLPSAITALPAAAIGGIAGIPSIIGRGLTFTPGTGLPSGTSIRDIAPFAEAWLGGA